ncbi:MAG: hypothetical protein KAG89_01215 [Fulvimarina manganoxydans]|uniref:hypothetical protein n=1 Tax=Fulvimarina manganoxydans TaxID=937218 RepID=UPI002355CCC1|nr:hypothetical protein [Fulvimarina manganoxydans]MCK5930768.1 hypothetical protein [Fulvimarina manganoxydans]
MSDPLIHSYEDGMSGIFRSNVTRLLDLSGLSADAAMDTLKEILARLAIADRVEASNLPAMDDASLDAFLSRRNCRLDRWLADGSAVILKVGDR